ncbi:MAG: hypothetical protein GTO45_17345 [Candidatus Aminicenantes bacterium]|nr:hypothetical protein [Candidatus Aminicenantes bacterium]NIM78477.1 hypothetical protein [Candidatus Aminicenantes bacterium]NIN19897.1 hypothetical protein [Candidatus Aminicenantes bacterium]NIN41614.1 hypothetical protein [Candidatus Aminicenantes bacterium]NIN86523.1 hypothetical protein [Candidatus Aminicenantes bacterium]
MNRKLNALIWIIIVISTAALYGDLQHAVDPRGKIENLVGEGDFVWDMDEQKFADCVKEGKETGRDFTIREIRWKVTGGDQDWVFTRITRMGDDNEPTIKRERFWITILKVDGVWVTRTKYRYRERNYKEGDTDEVGEKDKGRKFTAHCRITSKKIILTLTKKKQGYIFRITKKDGLIQVNLITMHDLRDWTMSYKKL